MKPPKVRSGIMGPSSTPKARNQAKTVCFKTRWMPDMHNDGSSGQLLATMTARIEASRRGSGPVQPISSFQNDGDYAETANRVLSEIFAPTAVLIDRRGDLRYLSGPVHNYLNLPIADVNPNLVDIARDGLKGMLQRLIHQATRIDAERMRVMSMARVRRNGSMVQVYLSLVPVTDAEKNENLFLVCFADETRSHPIEMSAGH
jgi:hypothetical protein